MTMAIKVPYQAAFMRELDDAKYVPPHIVRVLEFYANIDNYRQRGWYGEPDPSVVDEDAGRRAQQALNRLRR